MTALEQSPGNEQQCAENLLPFDVLYERYYARVYRYIRAHLRNDDDAADLVQQIFFQIWMRTNTYQPERGSFATWIFSIAHHRLVDYYRAVNSAIAWEPLYEITLTEMSPEEIVISAEALVRVKALLDGLSDEERALLALRYVARLSLAKIAAIIGKSVEATGKQLTRLIQRLQRQYSQQELEALVSALLAPAVQKEGDTPCSPNSIPTMITLLSMPLWWLSERQKISMTATLYLHFSKLSVTSPA